MPEHYTLASRKQRSYPGKYGSPNLGAAQGERIEEFQRGKRKPRRGEYPQNQVLWTDPDTGKEHRALIDAAGQIVAINPEGSAVPDEWVSFDDFRKRSQTMAGGAGRTEEDTRKQLDDLYVKLDRARTVAERNRIKAQIDELRYRR